MAPIQSTTNAKATAGISCSNKPRSVPQCRGHKAQSGRPETPRARPAIATSGPLGHLCEAKPKTKAPAQPPKAQRRLRSRSSRSTLPNFTESLCGAILNASRFGQAKPLLAPFQDLPRQSELDFQQRFRSSEAASAAASLSFDKTCRWRLWQRLSLQWGSTWRTRRHPIRTGSSSASARSAARRRRIGFAPAISSAPNAFPTRPRTERPDAGSPVAPATIANGSASRIAR